ncbi:transposase [Escherichia coli]|nr:transposase [Escherichia coli]HBE3141893.1 relaxase [Escherichia coli]HBE3142094.1 relaxase [Escherichia coli]HBE3142100.1 relaxase [Escherichia coli]HBE3142106.1 relaxase [Escherichia coli]
MKTAALDLARERQAHEAGARTRATAHERTPQQERQKAAREAERGREAWTLGQGMKRGLTLSGTKTHVKGFWS